MSKGAFWRLRELEYEAFLDSLDPDQRHQYAFWYGEPFEHGVLRQFSRAMAVAGWAHYWGLRS